MQTDGWEKGEKIKRQKSKYQRRQPPKCCIFNKSDMKLFTNANNLWKFYPSLPPNNWWSSTLLTSIQTTPSTPLHTSEVILVNFQTREEKQYPEILFVSWSQYLSRYHHHHHHITPILCHHITPILIMDHRLHRVTPLIYMYHHHHHVTPLIFMFIINSYNCRPTEY